MENLEIKPPVDFDPARLWELVHGYTSNQKFEVTNTESLEKTTIEITLQELDEPYIKRWKPELELEALTELGKQAGCWLIVCETRNTNAPAIQSYRKLGFEIGAVDLSYYTDQDMTDFEVTIFMKLYLEP